MASMFLSKLPVTARFALPGAKGGRNAFKKTSSVSLYRQFSNNPLSPEFQDFLKRALNTDKPTETKTKETTEVKKDVHVPASLQRLVESLGVASDSVSRDPLDSRDILSKEETLTRLALIVDDKDYASLCSDDLSEMRMQIQHVGGLTEESRLEVVRGALSNALADLRISRAQLTLSEFNSLLRVSRVAAASTIGDR